MKCYNCGFENEDGVTYCHECGVNLKREGKKNSSKKVDVLNNKYKVQRKRQPYPVPPEDSIKAKLMYKHDERTGELRIAKTKCATIVVFSAFFIFSFGLTLFTQNIVFTFFAALIFGIIFAVPTAILGHVLGVVIDRIFN